MPPRGSDLLKERIGLALAFTILVVYAAFSLDQTALWHDEGYTLGAINDLGSSLRRTHGTMGLYYSVMWLWGQISTVTWWLRLPSTLFAIATLVALRPIARRIGGSTLVLVALPMAAMLPMFAWKATEARSYALETLLVCLSWLIAIKSVDSSDDRTAARWSLALIPLVTAGVLTHGLFMIHMAPIALIVIAGPRPLHAVRWMAPAAVVGTGVTLTLHLLGAESVGATLIGGPQAMVRSILHSLVSTSTVPRLILLVLLVLGTMTSVQQARGRAAAERAALLAPISWAFGPMVILMVGATLADAPFLARYLAPSGVGLALLLSMSLLDTDHRIAASRTAPLPRFGIGPVAAAGLVVALVGMFTLGPLHDDDWRAAAKLVAADSDPDDGVIFAGHDAAGPVHHRVPFEAAWREVGHDQPPMMISPPRPLGEVRRFDRWVAEDQLPSLAMHHARVWIIEHQEAGADRTTAIKEKLVDVGFVLAAEWMIPGDISILLMEDATGPLDSTLANHHPWD